jgi:hypothetical protein
MSRQPIQLRINKLVLPEGMADNPTGIGGALERELARLLADQGLPSDLEANGNITHLDGGTVEGAGGDTTEMVGTQIARAIYEGMKP